MEDESNFKEGQQAQKVEAVQGEDKIRLDMLYNMSQSLAVKGGRRREFAYFSDVGR